MDSVSNYSSMAVGYAVEYGSRLLLAIITLFVGLWIVGFICRLLEGSLVRAKIDETLRPFLVNLASWGLKVLVFISVASMLGVQTTSFVAVLGAAGLAVGLALQGSLSNFAGGVLLLIFRPYKVGDLIEAQGYIGVVKEVQIFTTIIVTPENKRVIIPNGAISNGSIVNFTAEGQLRVDLVVGISYESDIAKAKQILLDVMRNDPKVLSDPAPSVNVMELADSSVNLAVRPFCKPEHYWDVYFGTYEKAKLALDANGISIPFPQRDVHLIQSAAQA